MITGYNTDVRHNDVVFHVQTEDKGLSNPFIESLVYVGGQVLASKRSSYSELIVEGKGEEKEIVALMDHQHRTMIAAIRHGKLDTKLQSLLAGKQTSAFEAAKTAGGDTGTIARPAPAPAAPPPPASPAPAARPLPPPASAPARERTLDQVILEYLTNEADQEQLVLLVEDQVQVELGKQAQLAIRTRSSKSGLPVVGSQVSVRMISTVADPRILATGRTDDEGLASLTFEIPAIGRGTAALIITAVSAIGRAELKHLL
ncbi:MAG TPA: hypothetical protein VH394_01145 [Thermoanaerobaculia bacterium]|jgi:hypothetical protein|nr:hypothetical protein [Thermoanaerobaculia bacterium]